MRQVKAGGGRNESPAHQQAQAEILPAIRLAGPVSLHVGDFGIKPLAFEAGRWGRLALGRDVVGRQNTGPAFRFRGPQTIRKNARKPHGRLQDLTELPVRDTESGVTFARIGQRVQIAARILVA